MHVEHHRRWEWVLLVVLVAFLGWQTKRLVDQAVLPPYDFVAYWAAGRLELAGRNPYSPEDLLAVQHTAGWTDDQPLMIWNPPWTLPFIMPLGLLSYRVSRAVWLWLSIGLVIICAGWTWELYGGPAQERWLAWLVGLTFLPTLFALALGQISVLILAGTVGFLYFEKRRQWWLAGATLVLLAIKPHLLYLLWAALFLWALTLRRWTVLAGAALSGLLAVVLPMHFNLSVIGQYLFTLIDRPPIHWKIPTLGLVLRMLFGQERYWLQFVPAALGLGWLLFYWQRHKHNWHWAEHMPLLLLVSLVATPYAWMHDQIVLVPALIQVTVWLFRNQDRLATGLVVVTYGMMSSLVFVFWHVWMAPAMLLGYLLVGRLTHQAMSTLTPALKYSSSTTGRSRWYARTQ